MSYNSKNFIRDQIVTFLFPGYRCIGWDIDGGGGVAPAEVEPEFSLKLRKPIGPGVLETTSTQKKVLLI